MNARPRHDGSPAGQAGKADRESVAAPFARVTIASYPDYGEAETAVNRLSDQGFPVHQLTIVSTGLRSVEHVEGRMTAGRAALVGAGAGAVLGTLLALVFRAISPELNSTEVFLCSLGVCAVLGALSGALFHVAWSSGRREFVSVRRMEADRYDVQVNAAVAGEAKQVLDGMPPGSSG